MQARWLVPIGGVALVLWLWTAHCTGPRVAVTRVHLVEPAGDGVPYTVQVMLENRGPGRGTVAVTARLWAATAGHTVQQRQTVALEAHEATLVAIAVRAPRGAYTPEVTVEYPPR